jgi:uncharacterized protein (TIGR03437 family)
MKLARLLLFPAMLYGQVFIDGVFPADGLAPGSFADIEGFGFDGAAKVTVGGLEAPVYAPNAPLTGEVSIFIQIPSTLPPGPTTLVLTQGKDVIPFPVTIVPAAPQFVSTYQPPYLPNYYPPSYRIERSLPSGGFGPWSCDSDENAKPGDLVRVYMTGLGATNPIVVAGFPAPESPLAVTDIQPSVMFGKSRAEVTELVLVPANVGLYRVTFKIPDEVGQQTLSIATGGRTVSAPLTAGNAVRSFYPNPAAPLSIQVAATCGGHFMAPGEPLIGDSRNPGNELGNITVIVHDSGGPKSAAILFANQDRIEYITPEGALPGTADLEIVVGSITWRGTIDVKPIAPRVLEIAPGFASAYLVRVRDGTQSVEPVFRVAEDGKVTAVPIDFGPEGDFVYLCVFGTGWRGLRSPSDVALEYSSSNPLTAGGMDFRVPALYGGAQGEYAGVDQVNFLLPRALAGSGSLYTVHTFLNVQGITTGLPGLVYK